HVRVVVLTRDPGRPLLPGRTGTNALDLVGDDLFAVARTADDDPQRSWVLRHSLSGSQDEGWVVVAGVVHRRAHVHDLVSLLLQPGDEVFFEFMARMI